jgi:hypothetical protein
MRLTVVCVLWMGEFQGRHYSPAWVTRLRDMVAECLPLPHRFVCLSNIDVPGVETQPLTTGWPGWWAKLEMFDPSRELGDRVLYLDLDVFVTGDLTPLAEFPAPMALMPPSHLFADVTPRALPGVVRQYQASCIVFDRGQGRELFEQCDAAAMARFRSDQDWIGHVRTDCSTMPPEWFAKVPQCRAGVPAGVRLVLAHRVNLVGRTLAEVAA